jgi:crotonobetainyl-CoA:carnitine CoA-transferase CaiB-like acyl-CoA transferase
VPKFSATPGRVWRGAPSVGFDNQRVYGEMIGLSASELESLKRDKVI